MNDVVKAAPHYTAFKIQPIEFISANGLGFLAGNVVKYVCRAPLKNGVEDLQKARQYLDWLIAEAEGKPLEVTRK
jgi:hypothetical protein